MGYYTWYELEVDEPIEVTKGPEVDNLVIIKQLRKFSEGARWALDNDGYGSDSTKWYEYDTELKDFSKLYPDYLFTLHGDGEESEDLWKAYYMGGKSFITYVELVYEDFHESKLS